MKRNIIITLLIASIVMMLCSINISNAADNAKMVLTAEKAELSAGDKATITVKVTNITGTQEGINSFQGTLVYDNKILENVSFSPLNSWATPTYNEANGSIISEKGDFVKSDEAMFTISFTVKSDAKLGATKVQLNNAQVADTEAEYTATNGEVTINIVEKQTFPDDNTGDTDKPDDNTGNTDKPNNNTTDNNITDTNTTTNNTVVQGNTVTNNTNKIENTNTINKTNTTTNTTTNTSKNTVNTTKTDNTASKNVLPKTGLNGGLMVIIGVILVMVGIVSYMKYQRYKSIK